MPIRFKVVDVLVLVAAASIFSYAISPHSGGTGETLLPEVTFALFLVVLSTATVGAIQGRGEDRLFWLGYSAFGWTYLFVGLRLGFIDPEHIYPRPVRWNLLSHSLIGLAFGFLCAYLTRRSIRRGDEVGGPKSGGPDGPARNDG